MTPPTAVRRIVRFVSDGTGRSPEEVWMLATAAAAVIVTVAAVRGLVWVVDTVTDMGVRPAPTRRR